MAEIWLYLDFPSIKSFVFGTDPAKEIRGASALLDHLNDPVLRKTLQDALPTGNYDIIYSGGGNALLTFQEGITKEQIDDWLARYEREIRKQSGDKLRLQHAHVHYTKEKGEVKTALKELHEKLDEKRYREATTIPQTHTGILRSCASCSTGYATTPLSDRDDPTQHKAICLACKKKQDFLINQRQQAKQKKRSKLLKDPAFYEFVRRYDIAQGADLYPERLRPETFEDIAQQSEARPGYYGLIYADGDSMGQLVKKIDDLDQYKLFSETVEKSLKAATFEALQEFFDEHTVLRYDKDKRPLPVDILLLGGDDLVMAIKAEYALPFALHAARRFREISKEILAEKGFFDPNSREHGFSLSFGVAIAKEKQPFRMVLDQAEALLKSAKRARSNLATQQQTEGMQTTPFIDFADISQSRYVDLDALRKEDQGIGGPVEWTCWPRPLEDAQLFYTRAKALVDAGLTKGQMYAFANAAQLPGSRAEFETGRLLTRLPSRSKGSHLREEMVRFFKELEMQEPPPWQSLPPNEKYARRKRTALLDLATFYPYLKKQSEDR